MADYTIIAEGWYLISGQEGVSINNLISSDVGASYRMFSFLKVNTVYVPLTVVPELDDSSGGIIIVDPSNIVFKSKSTTDPFTIADGNLGVTAPTTEFSTNEDLALIEDYVTLLSVSCGLWVNITAQDVTPILKLEIKNYGVNSEITDASYQDIGDIGGDSTYYSTIYSYNVNSGDEQYGTGATTETIELDASDNQTINIVIQKDFDFDTDMIIPSITENDPYNDFYENNDVANSIIISQASHFTVDGSGISDNTSIVDSNAATFNTDDTSNTGTIVYTVINAASTNAESDDLSFKFTVNLSVIDTVPPLMRFYKNLSAVDTSVVYTYSSNSIGGKIGLGDYAYFRGDNTITITLNQSDIQSDPSANLLPKVVWYDQNNSIDASDNGITIDYTETSILDKPGEVDASEQRSYTDGEWRPGTYSLTYSCTDDASNNTTVDVDFIIKDDIPPTLTISDNSNNISAYTDLEDSEYDYTGNSITDSGGVQETGVGFGLLDAFITQTNSGGGVDAYDLYIYYSDVSANTWTSPTITEYSDYDGIGLNYNSYTAISNADSNVTLIDGSGLTDDGTGIENVNIEDSYGSHTTNTSLIRTYSLNDYNHDSAGGSAGGNNNTSIELNIKVYDNIPPVVSVTATPVLYKYNIDDNDNKVDASSIEIVADNVHQGNSISVNQYDDIDFSITVDKDCKCKIYNTTTEYTVESSKNLDDGTTTISLTHNDTGTTEDNELIFTIWDDNGNFYRFKQIMTVKPIPIYTFRMQIFGEEQKLLLRNSGEDVDNDSSVIIGNQSFVSLAVYVDVSGGCGDDDLGWSNSFTEDIIFESKVFGSIDALANYGGANDATSNLIGQEVLNSSKTQAFDTSLFSDGRFYEFMTLSHEDTFCSVDTSLTINSIDKMRISEKDVVGSSAVKPAFYTDVVASSAFYKTNDENAALYEYTGENEWESS